MENSQFLITAFVLFIIMQLLIATMQYIFLRKQVSDSTIFVQIEVDKTPSGDNYLIYNAKNNEFLLQTNKLENIPTLLLANEKIKTIFFTTKNHSMLALFLEENKL